ncbi:hypothetical protein EMIHUDRAFT_68073 [Emiliania huxleyi CCMP1516]|uniref:Uncharacterized protein n=4 Tax=Emiliania huxleyi TaxID=2903 RepID=A0A0D3IC39_EMIH1|nr:hypothetical protein EMIHUDRAFT_68073 [Emiliania huxleyi CCMP1516]EOD08824.1 hypothetical protein EMIHUDRAFT_68073 [Emiliania huxleyi CCMP1516]|eukprot:XP_005761253.1 hypothetical protein EMIHUDRAFT_68073 [Emiliania huxleyi CCMP1516]
MSTGCCNEEQQYFLVTIFAYSGAVLLLWRALVFKPFKLFAVALHEFCHAAAAAALCNRVTGIEVSWDEGGLASYKIPTNRVRCVRAFVLPAGYVGSTCSGCVLVIASAFTVGSQVCGILLAAACAIIAVYAAFGRAASTKERVLLFGVRGETDFDAATWPLELFLLLVGTVNMIYCTYDIYDDTVRRKVARLPEMH